MRAGVAVIGLLLTAVVGAQPPAVAPPGSDLEVYVMTMGPGEAIWERFGHNAVGLRDRSAGTDVVYNWGVFDFTEADFLPRFIRGEMRYRVEPYDALMTLEFYRRANRSIWIQELSLTPAQRVAVKQFVEWNAQEANKYYRYDYFADNCSTRARDALDQALGGAIRERFSPLRSGRSFRDEARRLADADVLYTGIDLGLGTPSDREMTRHEALFIPMRLRDALREMQVADSAGQLRPLVAAEREVFAAARAPELTEPRDYRLRYLGVGLALLAALVLAARVAPRAAAIMASAWCGVTAVLGVLLVILWGFTRHTWAWQNVNLLVFNPLWVLLAIWVVRPKPVAGRSRGIVTGVAIAAGAGLLLGFLRWPQHGEQIAALAALPHAWVLRRLLRGA